MTEQFLPHEILGEKNVSRITFCRRQIKSFVGPKSAINLLHVKRTLLKEGTTSSPVIVLSGKQDEEAFSF